MEACLKKIFWIDFWLCLPSSDCLNAEHVNLSLSQATQAHTHRHLPLSANPPSHCQVLQGILPSMLLLQLFSLAFMSRCDLFIIFRKDHDMFQRVKRSQLVSTEDLCLAPLRCWIFTLQASFKALHGPIAQSAIWERLTPTADIEQLNPLEEEWTNPRNFFERVFEHVPHFLTTKYVANPPTVG